MGSCGIVATSHNLSHVDEDAVKSLSLVNPSMVNPSPGDPGKWHATLDKAIRSVVAIHFSCPRPFDTDSSSSSQATGFVVDAEKGYILTNRHVVGPGPFTGYCVFDNHEECDVHPVYRDPVHDFGFLRFEPKAIKYMKLEALKLNPQSARVGVEIRIVGNDAGEKLSIHSGFISRLDRNAPLYGGGYNDFNTNYIQAAAATTGGSSGSPVVDVSGHAIALQAGGRLDKATTDFFLPLDRPLRALECLQKGIPITRGTIQTQWTWKPFDDCRRLGLTSEWESIVRATFPHQNNMLVAETVLPEGPADGKIQVGDILVKVNEQLLTSFASLDAILDASVGKTVDILLQREGKDLAVTLDVHDLTAITPDRFVAVAGGTFHNLSYQYARLYRIPCRGLYTSSAEGSFGEVYSLWGSIVDTVDHKKTPDLDTFIEVVRKIPDKSRIVVTYRSIRDLDTQRVASFYVDQRWDPDLTMAVRNDETGLWDFNVIDNLPPALPPVVRSADFAQPEGLSPPVADIVRSFVEVSCAMPLHLDGFPHIRRTGFGLVIAPGFVIVSRAVVPHSLCGIIVTVADSVNIEGEVYFVDPLRNYTVVRYDPALVEAPVQVATLSTEMIKQGSDTFFVGFSRGDLSFARTTVSEVSNLYIPKDSGGPRYRATMVEGIYVNASLPSKCSFGVLMEPDSVVVQALWLNYMGDKDNEYYFGMAASLITPVVDQIKAGFLPKPRILDIEASGLSMAECRTAGVSEEWIKKVAKASPSRHELFRVSNVACRPEGEDDEDEAEKGDDQDQAKQANGCDNRPTKDHFLQDGDIILSLNDRVITRQHDMDMMYDQEWLDAAIVRRGEEMTLRVPTLATAELDTTRALVFCGAVLQRPHHAVRQQVTKLHSQVYVSARRAGSPAQQYGLSSTTFITEVNGVKTPNLAAFVRETAKIQDNTSFRLRVVTLKGVPQVVTMKKNSHYFPMVEYVRGSNGGWTVHRIEGQPTNEPTNGSISGQVDEIVDEPTNVPTNEATTATQQVSEAKSE
ncbi:hypothetical protein Z517_10307 [Fonsecaea pedrosoi CBS 271.37]|uniref:Pro-apoptotic serine protease NMA111 n=1 Tax=Fonsecaea pedrosoi CBS 271.37 TaxID=1442368 RepID=A0A0D2G9U1_9EURO|nr:uncharacterized protein Z517_10307 [Fonsecaea pedrosoi CBS 271.37]KIW75565.1 hypothetical protein Z517_10307 [Fonsecaea pedrosoi CBS 271.37]